MEDFKHLVLAFLIGLSIFQTGKVGDDVKANLEIIDEHQTSIDSTFVTLRQRLDSLECLSH